MHNLCLASTTTTVVPRSSISPAPSPKFSLPSTTHLTTKIKPNQFRGICGVGKRENAETTYLASSASVSVPPPAKVVLIDQYLLGTLFASSLFAFVFLYSLNYRKKKVEEEKEEFQIHTQSCLSSSATGSDDDGSRSRRRRRNLKKTRVNGLR